MQRGGTTRSTADPSRRNPVTLHASARPTDMSLAKSANETPIPPRPTVLNISAYKFVPLKNLPSLRGSLLRLARESKLKGTILLSAEGLNLFVAGPCDAVESLLEYIRTIDGLADLEAKRSYSSAQPFRRMLVKIKKEIIAFGIDEIQPGHDTSKKISAEQLCQWLDAGREITLLDIRNDYEIRLGTFENAIAVGVNQFRNFANAAGELNETSTKHRPLVMFCTGGIRCEKAGPYLESLGFEQVFQLDGGILKYFERCQGKHYRGECFVFDQRVALDPQLQETETVLCFACRTPLTVQDQRSDRYRPNEHCPYCYLEPQEKQARLLRQRQRKLAAVVTPLPGSQPYTNRRFFTIPRSGRDDADKLYPTEVSVSPSGILVKTHRTGLRTVPWRSGSSQHDFAAGGSDREYLSGDGRTSREFGHSA